MVTHHAGIRTPFQQHIMIGAESLQSSQCGTRLFDCPAFPTCYQVGLLDKTPTCSQVKERPPECSIFANFQNAIPWRHCVSVLHSTDSAHQWKYKWTGFQIFLGRPRIFWIMLKKKSELLMYSLLVLIVSIS
jgi:hypothetical protein